MKRFDAPFRLSPNRWGVLEEFSERIRGKGAFCLRDASRLIANSRPLSMECWPAVETSSIVAFAAFGLFSRLSPWAVQRRYSPRPVLE